MYELNEGVNFNDIADCCPDVLFEELGRPLVSLELAPFVAEVVRKLKPNLQTRTLITQAISLSAKSAALYASDPPAEAFEHAAKLPGFAVIDAFMGVPPEKLGTFSENSGELLGHVCILIWAKDRDKYFFFDPTQGTLETENDDISFTHMTLIEIDEGQKETMIPHANGVVALYKLHPEIAVPELPAETLAAIDRCVPKALGMLTGNDG